MFRAEGDLRDAQARLDAATKNVRLQQRRVTDAGEKLKGLQTRIREQQAKVGQYELEVKSRDAHIEKLRTQQQAARNNKEYQAFLIEINTGKVDKTKLEEESLKVMQSLETDQATAAETQTALASEQEKLVALQSQIGDTTKALQDEVNRLTPVRDELASKIPARARDAFMRLADRYDGEAMSPLIRPDKRVEEYLCNACHMELVRDVYNRLHTRDELVFCPSCGRILYIPENLTPAEAVNKPKERKELKKKAPPAAAGRQSSAVDVLRSVQVEDDDDTKPAPRMAKDKIPSASAGRQSDASDILRSIQVQDDEPETPAAPAAPEAFNAPEAPADPAPGESTPPEPAAPEQPKQMD
ncbi:MAG TPA: C4-type zinc ribbon domain-containing protein [Tepidisphaeraceae bacterium]|nr:C4-type zinc ribbon domain-containing protein [Tepidisphaeraceae bacterium]